MNVLDLQNQVSIGVTTDRTRLATLLDEAAGGSGSGIFLHCSIIEGADRSGRAFSQEKNPPSSSFVSFEITSMDLADEFFDRFIHEARYTKERDGCTKGFKVQTYLVNNGRIVVVWAEWV